MKNFIVFIFIFFITVSLSAQKDSVKYNWGVYGDNVSSVAVSDSVVKLETKVLKLESINNGKPGEINIASPVEIKTISEEINSIDKPTFKGYRVQVVLSQDKNEVLRAQSKFLRYNKEVDVYIDRKAPNYRLRVGDFHNKFDAFAFQKKIDNEYPNSLVVSDQIKLPRLPEKEVEEVKIQKETE